jgi:predicted dinucleotide-binding enzyme
VTDPVGIIGAGRLGQAMARTALRAGRRVLITNSRGPESLASVVSALGDGVSAGTLDEASSVGIVVVAVPWDRVPEAMQGLNWNSQFQIGGRGRIRTSVGYAGDFTDRSLWPLGHPPATPS